MFCMCLKTTAYNFAGTWDVKETIWCLYFPQYSHTSTQNLQYCSSHIAVISLEIRFRIYFLWQKKNQVEGTIFLSGPTSQEKICDYLFLISNIDLISLRDGITGPLSKLRWSQDGWETSPEYILPFSSDHLLQNSAYEDSSLNPRNTLNSDFLETNHRAPFHDRIYMVTSRHQLILDVLKVNIGTVLEDLTV